MAADWIKWVKGLHQKPEVLAIAAELGIDRRHAAGCCMTVWEWWDTNTEDGNARSVTESFIDELAGVSGFAQAMRNAGWLVGVKGGLKVPNFDRHNGQSAKRRTLTAERVRRNRNAGSVTPVTPGALPEKRREEVTTTLSGSGEAASKPKLPRPAKAPTTPAPEPAKPAAPPPEANPPTTAPELPNNGAGTTQQAKPARKDQWALDLVPTYQAINPAAEYRDAMPLLQRLAKQYTQPTVKAVLEGMLAKGERLDRPGAAWEILTARCRDHNNVPPVGRQRQEAPVAGNSRGLDFYLNRGGTQP